MKMSKKSVCIILVICFVIAGFGYKMLCCNSDVEDIRLYQVNVKKVHNILEGAEDISILPESSDYKVIHVFNTWCACCKKEIAEMKKISSDASHSISGLLWSGDKKEGLEWLEKNGNHHVEVGVINDEEAAGIGITKAPMTFVVDKNGDVFYSYKGPLTADVFYNKIIPHVEQYVAAQKDKDEHTAK